MSMGDHFSCFADLNKSRSLEEPKDWLSEEDLATSKARLQHRKQNAMQMGSKNTEPEVR